MNEGANQSTHSDKEQAPNAEVQGIPVVRKLVVPEPVNPSDQPDGDRDSPRDSPDLVDRDLSQPKTPKTPKTPDAGGEETPVVRKLVTPESVNPSADSDDVDPDDGDRSPGLVDRDLSMVPEEESAEQMADSTAEPPVVRKLVVPEKP